MHLPLTLAGLLPLLLLAACSRTAPLYSGECSSEVPCDEPADGCVQYSSTDDATQTFHLCTVACESSGDCPAGGVCVRFHDGSGSCLAPCTTNLDCAPKTYCREVPNGAATNRLCWLQ